MPQDKTLERAGRLRLAICSLKLISLLK